MTKRKSKNALPTGVNKSLGNALTNRTEARHASVKGGPTIAVETYKVRFIAFLAARWPTR